MEIPIGKVLHYFDKIKVATVELTEELKLGDKVRIEADMPFVERVESMQTFHKEIQVAHKGDSIGIKVSRPCNSGDAVVRLRRLV